MKTRNFVSNIICAAVLTTAAAGGTSYAATQPEASSRHQEVLTLKPVGYWPADEGEGTVLHDLSGNGNNGKLFNVPWRNGLLDFDGRYEWGAIPSHEAYQSQAISLGGWAFTRNPAHKNCGSIIIGNNIDTYMYRADSATLAEDTLVLRLCGKPFPDHHVFAGRPHHHDGGTQVDVISGGRYDVVHTAGKLTFPTGKWQHLIFTYAEGVGRIYLNGELVGSQDNVPFNQLGQRALVLGCDAGAFSVHPPRRMGLDGSLRDIVLFDRALSAEEVARLHETTQPKVAPIPSATDIPAETNAALSVPAALAIVNDENRPEAERAQAILSLAGRADATAELVPVLRRILRDCLQRDGIHVPRIDDLLRNSAIRALLEIAPADAEARELLGQALAKPIFDSLDLNKPYLAQVKLLVQNGKYMDALEVYRDHRLNEVPPIRDNETWFSWMGGDEEKKRLPGFLKRLSTRKLENDDVFLSQGNPWLDARSPITGNVSYTSVATWNGATYVAAIERISQEEVDKIYHGQLEKLTSAGADGVKGADMVGEHGEVTGQWRRLRLIKVEADGSHETVFPVGDWFIFDVRDGKMAGWSLGIDQEGLIHLMGGMHNKPYPGNYLSGVWEKIGLSTNVKDKTFPALMYWVSKKPGDITSFEFVGHADNPRNIPSPTQFGHPGGLNYMNFVTNRKTGTLFCYGRVYVDVLHGGRQTWGLYRYDAAQRRWSAVGGDPSTIPAACDAARPGWSEGMVLAPSGRRELFTRSSAQVFAYAWQPGMYNYIRAWGFRFDPDGRMYCRLQLQAVDGQMRPKNGEMIAFSDDEGDSWHRADGTPLKLPLTLNPAPEHNADIDIHGTRQWWELWESLLLEAGYSLKQPR